MTHEEQTIEGVIIRVDYGYGMKYNDPESLYLKLEIQQFDGAESVQLFRGDKIGKLLIQFKHEYSKELSINQLKLRKCYLLNKETNGVCDAIAVLPPSRYPQYSWIYNDNWD